jgi:hypothetical protein
MIKDEVIEMARQGGFSYLAVQTPNDLIAFAKLVAEKEREEIKQEFWLCLQSDLENGVKSLNEKAYKNFAQTMPELNKFSDWLESRGQE